MLIQKEKSVKFNFDGLEICDYTAGLSESSSFAVITAPPKVSHKLSWSKKSDKYYYIIEGEIDFIIDSEKFLMKQGDFCIVKKGVKFKYENNSIKEAKLILVHTPAFDLNEEAVQK
jgi:mannose-6-phosphate isomerase-like protein (cupin superfamily)